MNSQINLPAFARADGLQPVHVTALHPAVTTDGRALRFEERDAEGRRSGVLTMHGHGHYSFSPGGARDLLVLDHAGPSAPAGEPPRLLIASGAYAALCAAVLATKPSVVCASGGCWRSAGGQALAALIRARAIDDVLILEEQTEAGRRFSWEAVSLISDTFGARLLPRVVELPAPLPELLRAWAIQARSAA